MIGSNSASVKNIWVKTIQIISDTNKKFMHLKFMKMVAW